MTSSFTTNKNIEKPAHNDYVDDWDVPVNADWNIVDACLGNVSSFNVTSVSSHTFTASEIQATTLKFSGTLGNAAVTYKLTNGISGAFTVVNAASTSGASSALTLSWTSGGTALVVPVGATMDVYADGNALVWAQRAPIAASIHVSISLTGTGDFLLTSDQVACGVIEFTGTLPNTLIEVAPPAGFYGKLTLINSWSNAGGSSQLGLFGPGGGGAGFILTRGATQFVAFTSGNAWLIATGTQP